MEEGRDPYRNTREEKTLAGAAILSLVAIGVLQCISLGFLSHDRPPPADWDHGGWMWSVSVALDRVEHQGHLAGTGLSILVVVLLLRLHREVRPVLLLAAIPAFLSQAVWVLWAFSGFLRHGWEPHRLRGGLEMLGVLAGLTIPWIAMCRMPGATRGLDCRRYEGRWLVAYPLLVFAWTIAFVAMMFPVMMAV